jgi:serine/threonine-protein kinase
MKRCIGCGSLENDDLAECGRDCQLGWEKVEVIVDSRYAIEAKLGAGAMGAVYRARDVGLGRRVALKTIAPHLATDPTIRERFQNEAHALAAVVSPYVVQIHATGAHEEGLYIAMEYVQGEALDAIIDAHNAHDTFVATSRAIGILKQIGLGLAAVHRAHLVHRDVKPSNIVIEESTGRPVLIDFGIAKVKAPIDDGGKTMLVGTPAFMAPEQLTGPLVDSAAINERTDIYALGCTAFELLTGREVWNGAGLGEIIARHRDGSVPRLSSVRPQLHALDEVVARCLATDPLKRYGSCDGFVRDLDLAAPSYIASNRMAAAAQLERHGYRVLIVDDDEPFRRFAAAAVELAARPHKAEIRFASSGVEALESFEQLPTDLVMLDFNMPQLDGTETLSMLRMLPFGNKTRVLVCSGDADEQPKWRFAALGVRDFVAKPVALEALAGHVRRLLSNATRPPPATSGDLR